MSSSQHSKTILLVDDDSIEVKLVQHVLASRELDVLAAGDGRAGLRLAMEHRPDLIILDVSMPVMDGYEATRVIRTKEKKSGSHVPIVAMTAHAMDGDRDKSLAVGMDDYIPKPIDSRLLRQILERNTGASPVSAVGVSSPVHASSGLVDTETLDRVVGGDAALLDEIISIFLRVAPDMIEQLDSAVKTQDAARIEQLAHKLRGSVANFRAEPVMNIAQEIETMGHNRAIDGVARRFQRLRELTTQLSEELSALQKRPVV